LSFTVTHGVESVCGPNNLLPNIDTSLIRKKKTFMIGSLESPTE